MASFRNCGEAEKAGEALVKRRKELDREFGTNKGAEEERAKIKDELNAVEQWLAKEYETMDEEKEE